MPILVFIEQHTGLPGSPAQHELMDLETNGNGSSLKVCFAVIPADLEVGLSHFAAMHLKFVAADFRFRVAGTDFGPI